MGYEDLEDCINNADYLNAINALQLMGTALLKMEDYSNYQKINGSLYRITNDYIRFRLERFDSEARQVISETYKVLGYNPHNPKQIK